MFGAAIRCFYISPQDNHALHSFDQCEGGENSGLVREAGVREKTPDPSQGLRLRHPPERVTNADKGVHGELSAPPFSKMLDPRLLGVEGFPE